jgi:phage shock protein B
MDIVAVLGVMIPLVAVLGGIFLAALLILRGGSRRGDGELKAEETRLIQDIYHGLIKMEERVEALETLLLERDRKEGGVS